MGVNPQELFNTDPIAYLIRAWLLENGGSAELSVNQLAEKLGVHRRRVSKAAALLLESKLVTTTDNSHGRPATYTAITVPATNLVPNTINPQAPATPVRLSPRPEHKAPVSPAAMRLLTQYHRTVKPVTGQNDALLLIEAALLRYSEEQLAAAIRAYAHEKRFDEARFRKKIHSFFSAEQEGFPLFFIPYLPVPPKPPTAGLDADMLRIREARRQSDLERGHA